MQNLVLASTSVFRKSLLERLQIPFECVAPNVDETPLENETPAELVRRLSELKARAVTAQFPNSLIIGSDQVSVVDNKIVGKPHTHEKAVQQLTAASGKTIDFLTGLALFNTATQTCQVDLVKFSVQFRQLTPEQIERYLRKEQPYQCAGSFRSESLGIALFEKMIGDDPTALIGLPLIRLTQMLESEGFLVI